MAKNDKAKKKSGKKNSRIDLLYIIGFIAAMAMIFGSIIYVSPSKDGSTPGSLNPMLLLDFYDTSSVLITVGGTLTALMLSFPTDYFKNIPKHMKMIFSPTIYDPKDYISQLTQFATSARIEGILSLESKLTDVSDNFMKTSLMLVVDSVDPEKVKQMLESELDYLDDRHAQNRKFYEKGAAYAPAFGMIGTLIGLVKMLSKLAELGVDGLGPAMSIALLTTFYGTLLANLVFAPIANKLRVRHEEEYLCKMIIVEGVQGIQAGENPRYIEEKLLMLIPDNMKQSKSKKRKKGKSKEEEKEAA